MGVNPQLKQLAENEQININHPECPAGRDTKKRLYVRKRDGGLIGFCHHCQSKGGKSGQRNYIASRQQLQVHWQLELPADYTMDMHVAGLAWLHKAGITQAERHINRIGWSERLGRVILPIYQNGKLIAYQSRRVFDYDKGPKYLTDKAAGVRFPMFLGTGRRRTAAIAVVEDILSAIIVSRQTNAAALLGVHLSDANMHELIAMGYKEFIVWLDDDNPEVKRQQRKLMKRLSNYGDTRKITAIGRDPKELDDDDITAVLQGRATKAQAPVLTGTP